ncbi:MAG: hypothetical protein CMO80_09155 [Verrucomicrobiales bacterium]|nr:hypothetical protein [Verrucomicrobiales bacterium]
MRSFVQPKVLRRAGLAALVGTVACIPRLNYWPDRPDAVWFLAGLLAWCLFVMWGFVFGWEEKYGQAKPLAFKADPKAWGAIVLGGILAAILAARFTDPVFREIAPEEYPGSIKQWLAFVAFYLSLELIFVCFAPLAFFARLAENAQLAAGLTIGLGLAVMFLKLGTLPESPHLGVLIWLAVFRIAYSGACISLYRWGGILPVYTLGLIVQARLLVGLG